MVETPLKCTNMPTMLDSSMAHASNTKPITYKDPLKPLTLAKNAGDLHPQKVTMVRTLASL